MARDICSAHSERLDARAAAAELVEQLAGTNPLVIAFFACHRHDLGALGSELQRAFPRASVIGCTTAGELTQRVSTVGTVSLLALGPGKVRRAAAALAGFENGVDAGIARATQEIAARLEIDLRAADPKRYVGVVLVEGLRMKEEQANAALGNAAPMLSFVGGSAGDGLDFMGTRVFCNGQVSSDGAAVLLLDVAVPYAVGKTCSFEPLGPKHTVTKANVPERIVYELDGRPVLDVYAEAVGKAKSELDSQVFMTNPLGLMIDGKPWIRSPQRTLPDGGLKLYCQLLESTDIHVMRNLDLVADTRAEIERIRSELGGRLSGGPSLQLHPAAPRAGRQATASRIPRGVFRTRDGRVSHLRRKLARPHQPDPHRPLVRLAALAPGL